MATDDDSAVKTKASLRWVTKASVNPSFASAFAFDDDSQGSQGSQGSAPLPWSVSPSLPRLVVIKGGKRPRWAGPGQLAPSDGDISSSTAATASLGLSDEEGESTSESDDERVVVYSEFDDDDDDDDSATESE